MKLLEKMRHCAGDLWAAIPRHAGVETERLSNLKVRATRGDEQVLVILDGDGYVDRVLSLGTSKTSGPSSEVVDSDVALPGPEVPTPNVGSMPLVPCMFVKAWCGGVSTILADALAAKHSMRWEASSAEGLLEMVGDERVTHLAYFERQVPAAPAFEELSWVTKSEPVYIAARLPRHTPMTGEPVVWWESRTKDSADAYFAHMVGLWRAGARGELSMDIESGELVSPGYAEPTELGRTYDPVADDPHFERCLKERARAAGVPEPICNPGWRMTTAHLRLLETITETYENPPF